MKTETEKFWDGIKSFFMTIYMASFLLSAFGVITIEETIGIWVVLFIFFQLIGKGKYDSREDIFREFVVEQLVSTDIYSEYSRLPYNRLKDRIKEDVIESFSCDTKSQWILSFGENWISSENTFTKEEKSFYRKNIKTIIILKSVTKTSRPPYVARILIETNMGTDTLCEMYAKEFLYDKTFKNFKKYLKKVKIIGGPLT